jgi:serine protease Do
MICPTRRSLTTLCFALCLAACSAVSTSQESLEMTFARVSTAVVTIHTTGRALIGREQAQWAAVRGIGSGVLVGSEGHILTASHVVQSADDVIVEFVDGTYVPARVVASEPGSDVALLKLERSAPDYAQPAVLGDSDTASVGQRVFVVGAPFGISHTLTVGYLSARRPHSNVLSGFIQTEVFQTDAAINMGNSGGPLFDMRGEVIGIVSHLVSQTGGNEGLGFAITSNVVRDLLFNRSAFWTGIESYYVDQELARALNVPDGASGLLVQYVAEGSPAAAMGIRGGTLPAVIQGQELLVGGDIVMQAAGFPLTPEARPLLRSRLAALGPEDSVSIVVLRGGELVELRGALKATAAETAESLGALEKTP